MLDRTDNAYHEWTLADFIPDADELSVGDRVRSIRDHQCTPAFAKLIVRGFASLKIDFYLQRDERPRNLLRSAASLDPGTAPDPYGAIRPCGRSIASAAWHLEQAWCAFDRDGGLPPENLLELQQATCALLLPLEKIEPSIRPPARDAFPYMWIPCYFPKEHAFHQFDAVQLNAGSLQYRGSATSIAALFRFATTGANDLCTACAAVLLEHGGDASVMEPIRRALQPKLRRDPWLFAHEAIPSLVEDRSWDPEHANDTPDRAHAVRMCLVKPLAALYECGALPLDEGPEGSPTVLKTRLSAALANAS